MFIPESDNESENSSDWSSEDNVDANIFGSRLTLTRVVEEDDESKDVKEYDIPNSVVSRHRRAISDDSDWAVDDLKVVVSMEESRKSRFGTESGRAVVNDKDIYGPAIVRKGTARGQLNAAAERALGLSLESKESNQVILYSLF